MIENLKSLAVFAKTAELGSFRQAALSLSLSPSVVSHHVSELERRLSVPLLYRTTRQLSLTADGERLYRSAREMLAAAERGLDELGADLASPSGRLRLTAPALLVETSFSQDLARFAQAHPRVSMSVAFTEQRHDLLRDQLDLALRIGRLEDSTLRSRHLSDMPRVLVGSPAYVEGRARPRRARDLAGWDLLHLSARGPEVTLVPPGKKTPVTLTFTPRVSVDSAAALRELAIAGLGITSLPEVLARGALAQRKLVEVLPGWRLPSVGVYALWPGGTARPSLTVRFVDFMAARLSALFAVPTGSARRRS